MSSRSDQILASLRGRLCDIAELERSLLTLRPAMDGHAGAAATDVAVDRLTGVREAIDQAIEEIEVDDGLYLESPGPCRPDPALAPKHPRRA